LRALGLSGNYKVDVPWLILCGRGGTGSPFRTRSFKSLWLSHSPKPSHWWGAPPINFGFWDRSLGPTGTVWLILAP